MLSDLGTLRSPSKLQQRRLSLVLRCKVCFCAYLHACVYEQRPFSQSRLCYKNNGRLMCAGTVVASHSPLLFPSAHMFANDCRRELFFVFDDGLGL